jgi:benzoyl-CoA reductase subunit C
VEYSYYLPMPNNLQSVRALPYLESELKSFKESIESWIGKKITEEDLIRGIQIMNKNRYLMKELYSLRKNEQVLLTGLEAMYIVVSSQVVDKVEHNKVLEKIIPELSSRNKIGKTGDVRLMLIGSENDDIEFVKMVESLGAIIVVDDHCTGSRYFWNETVLDKEPPLRAIACRYIDRPPCPSKDWPERKRLKYITNLAKEYNVQGAIILQQKFCDPHELDIPAIISELKKIGIPSLFLELDVTTPIGQLKVRTEAFLEMLRQEELF